MSLAPQELENNASKYASEAIKFDSQGARGMAITNYQKAIDSLAKLLELYPSSKLNELYKERCNSYHSRIKSLQESNGVEPAVGLYLLFLLAIVCLTFLVRIFCFLKHL